jgi:hypothetical protein
MIKNAAQAGKTLAGLAETSGILNNILDCILFCIQVSPSAPNTRNQKQGVTP